MSKPSFIDDLGVEGSEVIDAATLLQDYNEGSEVVIENADEPANDVEDTDDSKKDDKSFLDTTTDIEELLESFTNDNEEDNDSSKKSKEKKVETSNDDDSDDDDSSTNYFEVLGENLTKLGIFQKDEDDDEEDELEWNQDTFLQKFEDNTKRVANNLIEEAFGKYGPEYSDFLWKVAMEGVNPEEYFMAMRNQNIVDNFDLEQEENQERIVFEYFRLLEPDRDLQDIQEEIHDLRDLNKLDKKAEQARAKLSKHFDAKKQLEVEQAKRKQYEQEVAKQRFVSTVQQTIKGAVTQGHIDNIPFDSKDESALVSYLTETPYRTNDGRPVTEMYKDFIEAQQNPESLLKLAKFLRSGLKVDTAIKKAVKRERENNWNFNVGKKDSKKQVGGKNRFLD